jgi:membrane fusion protein (multidrug efflux system)
MANPFSRTSRSLATETPRYALLLWSLVLIILGVWLTWFCFVQVTVYEVSQTARLEVQRAARPVSSLVAGKIMTTHLRLGTKVEIGEVLVELDASSERSRVREEEARLDAIPPQLDALKRQIADEEQAARRAQAAFASAIEQARSKHAEALSAARFARENVRRLGKLNTSGQVSEIESLRAHTDADKAQASADALASEIDQMTSRSLSNEHEKRATLEELQREAAYLDGQLALSAATLARLRQELEKYIIRAPVSGEIGDVAPLDVGAYVDAGRVLGSIIPTGQLKVVAEFAPARVLGRVHPGQTARMRLDGFPWAQYGTIPVKVDRVAREIRDGLVRVEFLPNSQDDSNPLMQHGLTGSVEIAIERTTPAVLALRAAGQTLTKPTPQSGLTDGPRS